MNRTHFWIIFALITGFAIQLSAQTQEEGLTRAIRLYDDGYWEESVTSLNALLYEAPLTISQRTRAYLTLAKAYISLDEEPKAIESYKQIARENPALDMRIFGEDASSMLLKNFGQALLEVREEERINREQQLANTSRRTAFFYSAAVPGWGQRYQGYRNRGYVMLGLTGASIAYAIIADRSYRNALDTYEKATPGANFERFYSDVEDQADRANLALSLVAGTWLFNMIDAGLQGPNITRPEGPISLTPPRKGLGMTFSYRF